MKKGIENQASSKKFLALAVSRFEASLGFEAVHRCFTAAQQMRRELLAEAIMQTRQGFPPVRFLAMNWYAGLSAGERWRITRIARNRVHGL